jgi:hypothetical protein
LEFLGVYWNFLVFIGIFWSLFDGTLMYVISQMGEGDKKAYVRLLGQKRQLGPTTHSSPLTKA